MDPPNDILVREKDTKLESDSYTVTTNADFPKTTENPKNKESIDKTRDTNRTSMVRFSENAILIPVPSEKFKSDRKREFKQRKYSSVEAEVAPVKGEAQNQNEDKSKLLRLKSTCFLRHSAEARLETRHENPDIRVNINDGEKNTDLGPTGDEQLRPVECVNELHKSSARHIQDKHSLAKENSGENDHTLLDTSQCQSRSSDGSSSEIQVSERIFGYKAGSFEWLSDESDSDGFMSLSNRKADDKKNIVSISDSDEYDTDLDIDPNFGKAPVDVSDTSICKNVYLKYCRKWKITPQRAFLEGLTHRSLSLRYRSLGSSAIAPACKALKDNLRVERLNLEGVDVTDIGSRHIAEMLLDNICVTHVNLSNNSLGLGGAQLLGHVIAVTRYITHLNVSGNKFDDNSAWFLADGISTNTTLESLDMSNNQFESISGKVIGKALVINKHLKVLNLSWNKLCGKGSVSIFHALMFNKTLEKLDISWNGIGYEGSVALSKCFKKNRNLKEIDVSNNGISWLGAPLIALGLKKNDVLRKLKIGHNPLTTTGCLDLLEAASAETNGLNLLDASEVSVVGEADLLAATISRRRKFTFLHGRILPTHDKLGEKQGREINPMLRIIEYLRLLGLRPLELMKSFHKTASYELPRKEFVEEIKRIGVKLHPHEIEALANSISSKGYDNNLINYRKLAVAVREVVQEERMRKIKEREEWRQIRTYHEKILRRGTLSNVPIPRSGSLDAREKDWIAMRALLSPLSSTSSVKSPGTSKTLSLCAPLESTASRTKTIIKKRTTARKTKKH